LIYCELITSGNHVAQYTLHTNKKMLVCFLAFAEPHAPKGGYMSLTGSRRGWPPSPIAGWLTG